jgi:hypothetical protein
MPHYDTLSLLYNEQFHDVKWQLTLALISIHESEPDLLQGLP